MGDKRAEEIPLLGACATEARMVQGEGPVQAHKEPGKRLISLKESYPFPNPRRYKQSLTKARGSFVPLLSLHSSLAGLGAVAMWAQVGPKHKATGWEQRPS